MSSILKVDQIQLSNGNTPTAGDLGLNTTGSVLQVVLHSIPDQNISAGSTNISFGNYSITKKYASSNILILVDIEYSNIPTSDGHSGDDNSALKLRNTTDGVYVNNRSIYNENDAFFATDTSHYYSGISGLNAGEFGHHTFSTSSSIMDTTNTAGTITYQLQASAQNSQFRLGRFGDCTLTMMEIAG